MNLEKIKILENKIYNEIPMTKIMGISLVSYDETHLTTKAPLDININDKGSAFGGSLSSVAIISSWCLARLIADEIGFDDCDILVIKNETSFIQQVLSDIYCKCTIPSQKDINIIKNKLKLKGSTSIKIKAEILEEDCVCMVYEGIYVIKNKTEKDGK